MVRSQELTAWANLSVGTDGDKTSIEHGTVVVDKYIFTQFNTMSMVAMKWWRYRG
jgi:hypothetical protein